MKNCNKEKASIPFCLRSNDSGFMAIVAAILLSGAALVASNSMTTKNQEILRQ